MTLKMRVLLDKKYSIALHSLGIYLTFSAWGLFQEKINTIKYNGELYRSFLFPNILQSFAGLLLSNSFISKTSGIRKHQPHALYRLYFLLTFLQLASGYLANFLLGYLSYPTLIASKSCKLLPIALMNMLFYRQTISIRKCFTLCLTTISVLVFSMSEGSSKPNSSTSVTGVILMILGLLIDGLYNTLQDEVFRGYQVSSSHMMFHLNLYKLVISMLTAIITKELNYSFSFLTHSPSLMFDLIMATLLNVLGQVVIYSMLEKHGAYILTTVNITRKILSLILSLVIFGHKIVPVKFISALGVLVSIGLEMADHGKPKRE